MLAAAGTEVLDADQLVAGFFLIAALCVALALVLFGIKLVNRYRLRAAGVRRAHYIAAIGELVARHAVPDSEIVGWSSDPVFLEVLFDYLTIVTGEERAALDRLVDKLDLAARLGEELQSARRKRQKLRSAIYLVEIAEPDLQDVFVSMLSSSIDELRLHGVRGLSRIADPTTVPRILSQMEREQPWMAARFADALVEYGPPAVPHLTRYLVLSEFDGRDTEEAVRLVIRVLGLIGDLAAEPFLLDILDSTNPILRVSAVSALGSAGSPASVSALLLALGDEDWKVRARAAAALGGLSDGSAVEPLGVALRDSAWWVRQNSAQALAELPGGIDRLLLALGDHDRFARDAAAQRLGVAGYLPGPSTEQQPGDGASVSADERVAG